MANSIVTNHAAAPENPTFNEVEIQEAKRMIAKFPEGKQKSAVLGLLHLAQAKWGWVSVPVMDYVAGILNIEPIEVYEVATFYTMFHLQPTGKYVLEVCRTSPCCLLGSEETVERLQNKLGIKVGDTTPDGMFTLKEVECLAACGFGPVIQIHEAYHEHMTPDNAEKLVDEMASKHA